MAYYGRVKASRFSIDVKTLGILAIVITLFGLFLISSAFKKEEVPFTNTTRKGPRVLVVRKVLIAERDLIPGDSLKPSMFSLISLPTEGKESDFPSDFSILENRFAATKIKKGSIIRYNDISNTWLPNGKMTEIIPEGFRAVTIEVDQAEGIEGWAAPQARVDVTWSSEHRGSKVVSTVVENAQILSIERSVAPQRGDMPMNYPIPRAVTLLVSIKDAQRIQLAKKSGDIGLTLRGESDSVKRGAETLVANKLFENIPSDESGPSNGKVSYDGKSFELHGKKLVSVDIKKPVSGN